MYGYKTNREFIDKTYQLLNKLDKRGIWNKDTLIIGLDKSVRPLAYTIRKLSKEEGRETPDIRFFNYGSKQVPIQKEEIKQIIHYIKNKKSSSLEDFSKYKKILVLDEHAYSGMSLKNVGKILNDYLENQGIKDKITFAVLGITKNPKSGLNKADFIFVDTGLPSGGILASEVESGIEDEGGDIFLPKNFAITKRTNSSFYKPFVQNRTQLQEDIIKYLYEKNNFKNKKRSFLEKILKPFSFLIFLSGIFFGYNGITGNIFVNSPVAGSPLGMVLILLGLLLFFFSNKNNFNNLFYRLQNKFRLCKNFVGA